MNEPTGSELARLVEPAREGSTNEQIDLVAARQAVADLLRAMGFDPESERFARTPERVAHAFEELTSSRPIRFSTFENDGGYGGPILVKDIGFISLCEHHLLPFQGRAHVGYIPNERIAGLSVFADVVDTFSRDLLLQETLTQRIADTLMTQLQPRAVGVVVEAEHMCVVARGPKARGTTTVTSVFMGDEANRADFQAAFTGLSDEH